MQLTKIQVKNFRLLLDVEMVLHKEATVIVGRNNSGKTSLTELFRRLLCETSVKFILEDFSIAAHEKFWNSYKLFVTNADEQTIRTALPFIEVNLAIEYDKAASDLAPLTEFIIDINPACTDVSVNMRYELVDGGLKSLFADIDIDNAKPEPDQKVVFFKAIKGRITGLFKAALFAVDPGDITNRKPLEWPRLRSLIMGGFINAQRGLDDTTDADNDVLGTILSALFKTAKTDTATPSDKLTAQQLEKAVEVVQGDIDKSFSDQLKAFLPAIELFGYPGLPDPKLRTETILGVERLLKDHTKIRYPGANGISLPEGYNGLGARNLIFIIFKLLEYFKSFQAAPAATGIHILFIEEPEAHLHPQMQEVFIRKLTEIAKIFADKYNSGVRWPVQFVVTTHSSHLANKAPFSSMRYFLATPDGSTDHFSTRIKDLGQGFSGDLKADEEFLHQYMTLTQCDLLFADRAVLVEGTSERLLLPRMVEKVDDANADKSTPLGSQYLCIVEIGGAFAHRFFKLLDFLELRTLIITDLDSVDSGDSRKACPVSAGTHSSNGCINDWFKLATGSPTLGEIIAKSEADKEKGLLRIAYQIPEVAGVPSGDNNKDVFLSVIGRSFEAAFHLANPTIFSLNSTSIADLEADVWEKTKGIEKTDFALKYAIEKRSWTVPRYIGEGLTWLASRNGGKAATTSPVPATA
jgi:predicted ATP-dependent endonuclease of OLD family